MAKRKRNNRGRNRTGQRNKPQSRIQVQPPLTPAPPPKIDQLPQAVLADGCPKDNSDSNTEELTQAVDRHVRLNTWFTFAIMAATVAQVIVGCVQWNAMKAQNVDTRRQADQTDKTLELMRVDQRAWLASSAEPILPIERMAESIPDVPRIDEEGNALPMSPEERQVFRELYNWKVRVRNTGATPAVIKYSAVAWYPNMVAGQQRPFDPVAIRESLSAEARAKRRRHTVIAPDDSMVFGMQDVNQAYAVHIDRKERLAQWYASRVAGVFIYDDIWGEEHTLFCIYRHDVATGALESRLEDGYAD